MRALGVQLYDSHSTYAVPAVPVPENEARVRTLEPHRRKGDFAPVYLFLMPRPKEEPTESTGGKYCPAAVGAPVEVLVLTAQFADAPV